jgi:acyl-CoA oxidase
VIAVPSAPAVEKFRELLRSPLFDPHARHTLSLHAYMDLTIDRMRALCTHGLVNNDMWMGQRDEGNFRNMCEIMGHAGAYDFALASTLTDHLIAGNVVFTQASQDQVARYHDEIVSMTEIYAFCCTEIGGGTNLREIETEVSYRTGDQHLMLRSPRSRSCKFWIGNALHAATVGVVLARLFVDGADQGHHWFRVPLRAQRNMPPLAGVTIMPCDPKGGIHANQVAGIRFHDVALPRDALLAKNSSIAGDGTFHNTLSNLEARFINVLETCVQERLFPLVCATKSSALATYVTYRFAKHRILSRAVPNGSLITYTRFRQRLYPTLLRALALRFLEEAILIRFERDWNAIEKRKDMHILAATAKCASWIGLAVLSECREMCGSQGFHQHNQIVTLRTDYEVNVTFAGDNTVMAYQIAKRILGHKNFTHIEAVSTAYTYMLTLITEQADREPRISDEVRTDLRTLFLHTYVHGAEKMDVKGSTTDPTLEKIISLIQLLRPLPELITAPVDNPDYVERMTSPLYKSQQG